MSGEQLNRLKALVLMEKIGYLCEELGDPGRYFPELRSKNVLDTGDAQLIKSKPTDREKTEEFVTLISKRRSAQGQHGFDVFVEALKKQRVHAHVARALQRALNKKKVEEDKSDGASLKKMGTSPTSHALNRDSGTSFEHTPTSDVSNTSSGLECHPEFGPLPPIPPPPSAPQEDSVPQQDGSSIDPEFGVRPSTPPPCSSIDQNVVSPQQASQVVASGSFSAPPDGSVLNGHYHQSTHGDELGPQSTVLGTDMTTMSSSVPLEEGLSYSTSDAPSTITSTRSSYPSLPSIDCMVELDRLRKLVENLQVENKQLRQKYDEARFEIRGLKQQLNNQTRPSNLNFHSGIGHVVAGPHPAMYHYSSPGSLTPPRGLRSTRNLSPSPGPVGERDLPPSLRSAMSSGSINSYSSRGSYTPSPSISQV